METGADMKNIRTGFVFLYYFIIFIHNARNDVGAAEIYSESIHILLLKNFILCAEI